MTPASDPGRGLLSDLERFNDEGLYLLFDDGRELRITRPHIEQAAHEFERNPDMIPRACRKATAFAPCAICPKRDITAYCHAIPTVFPFLAELDRYLSYDRVSVVYRAPAQVDEGDMLHVTRTSMQRALQHVAILSLMYYCEIGLQYVKYFHGIIPFMSAQNLAERLYANILIDRAGDPVAIEETIAGLRGELDYTIGCQIERLRVVCRNDAFLNAFAGLHAALNYLAPDMRSLLLKRMPQ